MVIIFFFKQKTADEMRISDWSSDVCSSDLRPLVARQWNDLMMMIRRDVGPAIHREQRERLAVLIFAPDACHAEPAIALQREEPFIEALLRLVGRIGEFVEAVAQDQAAMRRKIAPFRTEKIGRAAVRERGCQDG